MNAPLTPPPRPNSRMLRLSPLRLAGLYLLVASVWILASDAVLDYIYQQVEAQAAPQSTLYQTLKGLFFVLSTTVLLYLLVRRFKRYLTDAHRAESEYAARFRQISDLLTDVISLHGPNGRLLFITPSIEKILQYTADEFMAINGLTHVHPDDLNTQVMPSFARIRSGATDTLVRYRIRRKDGTWAWLESHSKPILGPDGKLAQVLVETRDITERIRTHELLVESATRYRDLFELSPQPLLVFDRETLRILLVNQAAVEQYGYNRQEFMLLTVLDIRPEEDRPVFLQHLDNLYGQNNNGQTRPTKQWRHRRKDGSLFWAQVVYTAFDFEGRPAELVLINDVTEALEAKRKIEESEAKYRLLAENASDLVFTFNGQHIITYVSPSLQKLTGYQPSQLVGQPLDALFLADKPEPALPQAAQHLPVVFQAPLRHSTQPEGPWVEVHLRPAAAQSANDATTICIGSCHDISERRHYNQEKRELEAQKQQELVMAAIEAQEAERKRIAEDLHDDLGHLLTGVYFMLQKLNETLPEGSADQQRSVEASDLMVQAIDVTRTITRSLVPYALYQSGLQKALSFLCDNINRVGKAYVSFNAYLETDRFPPAVETTVYRVCQELLNNSLKYAQCQQITVQLFEEDGMLFLEVSDDGIGFDYQQAVATNSLGLKNIQKRVQALGGSVHVETAHGKGTTTFVDVPTGLPVAAKVL